MIPFEVDWLASVMNGKYKLVLSFIVIDMDGTLAGIHVNKGPNKYFVVMYVYIL